MDRVHSPASRLRFIISSQTCWCFRSSVRGFGGKWVGLVLLITLSSMLGPTERDGRWRVVGVCGSVSPAVVGVGTEAEVVSGSADVDAALAMRGGISSGEGGPLRTSSMDAAWWRGNRWSPSEERVSSDDGVSKCTSVVSASGPAKSICTAGYSVASSSASSWCGAGGEGGSSSRETRESSTERGTSYRESWWDDDCDIISRGDGLRVCWAGDKGVEGGDSCPASISNVETEASGSTEYPIFATMSSISNPPDQLSVAHPPPFVPPFMFFASSSRSMAGENSGTSRSSVSEKASSLKEKPEDVVRLPAAG